MRMNISYASSNEFIRHTATSIYSLLDNNKDIEEITVYLLSNQIRKDNIKRINNIVKKFNRELIIIDSSDINKKLNFSINTGLNNITTLTRLFLGCLLPETVDKILHIDCDTVVIGSLRELWSLDMKSYALAAVIEPITTDNIKAHIGLEKDDIYFNAGVFMANLSIWRNKKILEKFLCFYKKYNGNLFYCDQDIINGVLKGSIIPINPKYNFIGYYYQYPYYALKYFQKDSYFYSKNKIRKAIKNPIIIHYAGEDRPWKNKNRHPYRKYYEKYLSKTPWRNTPKETGKEIYFYFWYTFLTLTKFIPIIRRWIIFKLLPIVISLRKKR